MDGTPPPEYSPEFLFGFTATIKEEVCFFCTNPISSEVDPHHVSISIPEKTLFITHYHCFHQMAWSMVYYITNFKPAESVVN